MDLITSPQAGLSREQIDLIKRTIAKGATDDELALFVAAANRTGLDPFQKQIYAIKRNTKMGPQMTIQVGIDGFRLIAERTGEYEGQTPTQWCGADGAWRDVWLENAPPAAARVGVYRRGFREALYGTALFRSYNQGQGLWTRMPELMLAKCAEALALRRAFPAQLSGLYVSEEMDQADRQDEPVTATTQRGRRKVEAPSSEPQAPETMPSAAPVNDEHAQAMRARLHTIAQTYQMSFNAAILACKSRYLVSTAADLTSDMLDALEAELAELEKQRPVSKPEDDVVDL